MPEADGERPDGGFDPPPPARLSKLLLAVTGLTVAFALFALVARLLLHH